MKTTLLILTTLAAIVGFVAFGSSTNLFILEGASPGARGELTLCGRTTKLKPWSQSLIAIRVVRCEGGGSAFVQSPDSPGMRCAVGYVEPHRPRIHRIGLGAEVCGYAPSQDLPPVERMPD
jgi:hypothetical protein